jgi:hypothetical protein
MSHWSTGVLFMGCDLERVCFEALDTLVVRMLIDLRPHSAL